ncbi:MAG: lysoplasmalogenase [Acutalibacteraceae bacterium]
MKYLFLALFALCSAVHLYFSWKDEKKGRAITKPLLLLLLMLYYVFSCSKSTISTILLAALFTSWLGDVLLIPSGTMWFVAGGISFMISHFLFIATYFGQISFSDVPWVPVILLAVIYCAVAAKVISMCWKNAPKNMRAALYVYLLANSAMNVFAFMQMITLRSPGAIIAYIGALLFFISDCSLFLLRYYKEKKIVFKDHFTVMLTYLAGEFLITQGILMLTV